jgi:hypothetical protein
MLILKFMTIKLRTLLQGNKTPGRNKHEILFHRQFVLSQPNMCSGFKHQHIFLPAHENKEEVSFLLQFFKSTSSSGKFGNISLF